MAAVAISAFLVWGSRRVGLAVLVWGILALGGFLAWRVRKRRLAATWVVAGTLLLWLISGVGLGTHVVSYGVGHTDVRIAFLVLDAESDQPVKAASIRLRDPDYCSDPIDPGSPYKIDLETGGDGSVLLPLDLMFTDTADGRGKLLSFHIRYPEWDIIVSRDGYRDFRGSFADYERGNPRFHDGNTSPPHFPPPVVIRLRKQPEMP